MRCRLAREKRMRGYRVVINDGNEAQQSVYHLHLHLLSGLFRHVSSSSYTQMYHLHLHLLSGLFVIFSVICPTHIYIPLGMYMYIYVYIYMYVCVYLCVCVCVCVCV